MGDFVWNKKNTYKVIQLVESFPALWNCSLNEYKDRQLKAKCLETIGKTFQISAAEVGRKLHNLRCQMNGELRKLKLKQSRARAHEPMKSSWEFFDALQFLTGISECEETVGSVPSEMPKSRKRKHNVSNESLKKAVNHLENADNKRPRDDADVFAEGWAVIFRQLTKKQKIFAKYGIDEILMQGQLGMLTYGNVTNIPNLSNQQANKHPEPIINSPVQFQEKIERVSPFSSQSSDSSDSMLLECKPFDTEDGEL